MAKRYGSILAALTEAFEERGLKHDDGTPIEKVGEMMEESEYRELQENRLIEKTNRFRIKPTNVSDTD